MTGVRFGHGARRSSELLRIAVDELVLSQGDWPLLLAGLESVWNIKDEHFCVA